MQRVYQLQLNIGKPRYVVAPNFREAGIKALKVLKEEEYSSTLRIVALSEVGEVA